MDEGQVLKTTIHLRKYRELAGLSVYKLSNLTGISRQSIMKIEKGSQPTAHMIMKLCIALNVTPNELLGWKEKLNGERRITGGNDNQGSTTVFKDREKFSL